MSEFGLGARPWQAGITFYCAAGKLNDLFKKAAAEVEPPREPVARAWLLPYDQLVLSAVVREVSPTGKRALEAIEVIARQLVVHDLHAVDLEPVFVEDR